MSLTQLLEKYDVPVPRYTSYPAVPNWQETPAPSAWSDALNAALAPDAASLAVYVHLPFCETLCTFCGCNTVITRNHERSAPYVETVLAELDLYLRNVPALATRPVSQMHLGGGTPTFMPPDVLATLLEGHRRAPAAARRWLRRLGRSRSARDHARASRSDARARHLAHLARRAGFRHRSAAPGQPAAAVRDHGGALRRGARVPATTRSISILIYGLPGQSVSTMAQLADGVIDLRPDRLAVYSFARVPWIKPAQRKFKDEDVPVGAAKRELYETLRERLLAAGYLEIGLDHFALPHDALASAFARGTLHRNFMGYTDRRTTALLGLGVSAISETPACYHQNEKVITVYERRVGEGEVPTLRGHVLSDDDRQARRRDSRA